VATSLKGSFHAHGCVRCTTRYQDACQNFHDDGLCTSCRGGRAWQYLIDSAAPHECCRTNARMVTKNEKQVYRLAGTRLWFICATCARTHPFNPRRTHE
jgi:hypothetical protein